LDLARSCGFEQSLTLFINENGKPETMKIEQSWHVNADGPAAATAWGTVPASGKTGDDPKRLEELITIVDDDECACAGLRALIESLGRRTATFASAEDYLASDIREDTACLILDVHLPGMSGPDLQAHLIAEGRWQPTVFVTGRFEEHVQKRVIEAGALGYLTKPCNEKALLDRIEEVLRTTAAAQGFGYRP
jgi:CheY-like chemotaxis protein